MTKAQLIARIKDYAPAGVLQTGTPDALRRRIASLADIEYAAQEVRELLEAALEQAEDRAAQGGAE
jgi:hypothetical protein